MSTILHRREVNVAISAREAGVEFANASADVQIEFFAGMCDAINHWNQTRGSWPMQCRFLVDEMKDDAQAKHELAWRLETLVEHLRERTNNVYDIEIHLTRDRMPEPHQLVIVDGGIALWTGSVWLSQTCDDSARVIQWPVKWWAPLLCDNDLPDRLKERLAEQEPVHA